MRHRTHFLPWAMLVLLAVAACSAGSSTTPSSSSSDSPDADAIDHPTGATDVILRYEEGGGFVMPTFAATMVPHFTLYGDGTIVYRDPFAELPPAEGTIVRNQPLRTARLTESQVQELLLFALGEGGLAAARPEYPNNQVADTSTAVFTVDAGGVTKQVSVYALGLDVQGLADASARAAFARLAETLTSVEAGGVIAATDYTPVAYRGILFPDQGFAGPEVTAWPWSDLTPADFAPSDDPNGFQFPQRTMSADEVEALGINGYQGGFQNVTLSAPDGSLYGFSLRPLLPDENA
jgi:hypothetical protein